MRRDKRIGVLERSPRPLIVPVTAVIAVVGYAALWVGYHHGWYNVVDSPSLRVLHDFGVAHPGWVRFWEAISTVFGPKMFRVAGALLIVVALVRRELRPALFLILTVQMSGVLTGTAKGLADRPRPVTALASASSTSFPSGHALGSMVGVLALLLVLLPLLGCALQRTALLAGVVIVLAVGFARVALNVHHPSDVWAGWALGYAYVVLWAWLLRIPIPLRR